MAKPGRWGMTAAALLIATACTAPLKDREDPIAQSVIDDAGLNDLLLSAGDPEYSVKYFQESLAREPERADFRRGLAISLARAKRYPESARVYEELITLGQADPADSLEYAFVAIRLDRWDAAESIDRSLPSGLNTSRRHLLAAMVADHRKEWSTADAAYARAETMATNPADVLNNWGISEMSRGNLDKAEELFQKALSYNSRLFTAKNNLAIARGLQGDYNLPLVPMTDEEKATILNNLGIIATRKGNIREARGLFAAAVDAHPQHYEAAADRLAALDGKVQN
ncbi:tetratricopeptide repeat protein [Rhodobacteraceae bacterium NNCM2]|nr:tetratricopeptide repeat protein [Coraliihabitans acroporae]